MAQGAIVGPQGCVPLEGESTIKQLTAATDILTITGAASQSGDFLVFESSDGTERFSITSAGILVISSISDVGIANVGGALTVTGVTSLNSAARFSKTVTFATSASVGFFGAAAVGTQAINSTAPPATTSGSFGWDSSANWIIAATALANIRTALVNLGLITT
jgi:hypothetical protein